MKNKITNCLIKIILCICCVYFCSNTFVAAQSLDNSPAIVKNFGSSLKKINKKKKDKIEITKQNNVTATITADEVIRVDTVMVMNEILVLDENRHHIKGLKKEDFVIKEDNEIQEISTFLSGDNEVIPRSIVLIIDYSGSQLPYFETSIEAAKVSVNKLSPKDQMAIVTDNVELLQGFTTDKTLLKNKLESLKIKALSGELSSSKQYSALMATLNEMFDDKTLRPIIIFQTDGDELGILKGELSDSHYPNTDETSFSFKDILTSTEKTRATIYSIVPGICFNEIPEKEMLIRAKIDLENAEKEFAKLRHSNYALNIQKIPNEFFKTRAKLITRQQTAVAEIAKFTGGSTKYLEQTDSTNQIYSEIFSEMNQRYIIGYYPTNQERNGKHRNVVTEVRGHLKYKILGRKTYILT